MKALDIRSVSFRAILEFFAMWSMFCILLQDQIQTKKPESYNNEWSLSPLISMNLNLKLMGQCH